MKLSWKIFFISYLIIILTIGIGGFALINYSFRLMLKNQIDSASESNLYAVNTFIAINDKSIDLDIEDSVKEISEMIKNEHEINIYTDKENFYQKPEFVKRLKDSEQGYLILNTESSQTIQTVSRIDFDNEVCFVETITDLSDLNKVNSSMVRAYRIILLTTAAADSAILFIFSKYISAPISNLSVVTNTIAEGDYSKRISDSLKETRSLEVSELAKNFNSMVSAIEDKIGELNLEIENREMFISDFTHELKTPMTSIIGYSDMLRSYDLDEQERIDATDYIHKESVRLQNLSMKLLEIIVLNRDNPKLKLLKSELLEENVNATAKILSQKYNAEIGISFERADLQADEELILSLLYNLLENSCKACKVKGKIKVSGQRKDSTYRISVADNGCGIAPENIKRVTKPFFMEDKSRSRGVGGAGLGLALSSRIAEIHGTSLSFKSIKDVGTEVSFQLNYYGGQGYYEKN